MTKVSVEPHLRELLSDLHGAPNILRDGCAMGFNENGKKVLVRGREDRLYQAEGLVFILESSPNVHGQAVVAAPRMFGRNLTGIGWRIDSPCTALRQYSCGYRPIIGKLNAFKTIGQQPL